MNEMKGIVEGILFVMGDEGITVEDIADVLQVKKTDIEVMLEQLKVEYANKNRGITLIETANRYKLSTKKEHVTYFERLVETPTASTLSQAALETLAIIAYRQPITRIEIEEVRGVKTERPIHTLVSKGLVKEVGRSESTGRAILYGTTMEFLDYFGLNSVEELPPLPEKVDNDEELHEEADLFFEKFQEKVNDL